jgi:Cytochrome C'
MTKAIVALLIGSAMSTSSLMELAQAQSPAGAPAANASGQRVEANLAQLMRGTLYPESNVVFAAQDQNPADVPHAKDPSMATDPLASSYGKWQAVENNALAIAEVANLLTIPGRKCSNGLDVPLKNPDWAKFVQELRDSGMTAYAAAQTKDQDKMTDAAGVMTNACKNCHDRYREKHTAAERCK